MDGILPLWKEAGMTSHDCVFKVRKLLKMKKVGHTGTLDPDVDGVLPICLGRATKVAEYITDAGKSYRGEVTIGWSTTTEDASGELVDKKPVDKEWVVEEITTVLNSFVGRIQQTPPMFSAVKVNGKRLYEYARQGISVERPSRIVTIYSIKIIRDSFKQNEDSITFSFDVSCGKGTYIRTLAVMIGEAMGYPAHMSKLTRTSSAAMTQEHCITLSQLEKIADQIEEVKQYLFPLEAGVSQLKKLDISDKVAEKVKNGAVLPLPKEWPAALDEQVVFMENGHALAIYHCHPSKEGLIKPTKVLWIE
ncbi:tRNA pseudouridine(55) synthase TruB [Jeotgalibacillus soli]|uniref:tRNA pseudouridine synthase B n=1 Tax=Jeotgalibacillus soli TaxID=889306 RepID=A0A0C2VKF3_9BACL|nr:tRNA pseudouridine(55) synthase TruB [Jeotgalibacillus soli]KIL44931.1 hypothetical protein KP78_24750 [Jeotgalibacillus soli]